MNTHATMKVSSISTTSYHVKNKYIMKAVYLLFFSCLLNISFSCTTARMTVSPQGLKENIKNIETELASVGDGYQLIGSESSTKNELRVAGHAYSEYTGYSTRMENDVVNYDNFTYTDSNGNTIEFQIKYKKAFDFNNKEYIHDIDVVKCNCEDKEIYSAVCSENGIVKKITRMTPNQQSNIFNQNKTILTSLGMSLGVSLIVLISFFALL